MYYRVANPEHLKEKSFISCNEVRSFPSLRSHFLDRLLIPTEATFSTVEEV